MRKLIVQIIFLFIVTQLTSQNVYTGLNVPYDPCNPCSGANITYGATAYFNQPNQVASDFGPRYVKRKDKSDTPYDWHGGIDYNGFVGDGDNDKGYRLRAIVGGTIYAISTGSLKYIVIDGADHDFGYLHMFQDGTATKSNPISVGDCKFVRLDNNIEELYGILVPHNGQQRLLAVCPDNDCSGRKYTNPETQTTLTATNQVAAGDIIGVLGTSGRVGAHLHLNRYESLSACNDYANCDNYMLNPLEHVEHTGVNYACRFHNHSTPQTAPENEPQGFDNTHIGYPGTKSSTIMVRPRLNDGGNGNHYTAGTFNIRDVNLEIKPASGGSYSQLKGNNYESKILMGATDLYPHAYPSYINKSSESSQGGWSRQGIYNFAYRDAGDPHRGPYSTSGGRPYDDFYFPFYHRVHKNSPLNGGTITFADIPTDARYNDGNYLLRAKVTNVIGDVFYSEEKSYILDNFLPYLSEVNIKYNGDPLHQTSRVGDEGSAKADDGYITNQIHEYPLSSGLSLPNIITIEVKTSEPMQNVKMAYVKEPFYT